MQYQKVNDIKAEKTMENLTAENAELKDLLSYVALMNDIELPESEEMDNVQAVSENA